MKQRIFLFPLVCLLLATLACTIPGLSRVPIGYSADEQPAVLTGVSVSPQSGNGEFIVTMEYKHGAVDATVYCHWWKRTSSIDAGNSDQIILANKSLTRGTQSFSIQMTEPGEWDLTCLQPDKDEVDPRTMFTVVESEAQPQGETNQAEPTADPVVKRIVSPGTMLYYYYPKIWGGENLVTCTTPMQITLTIFESGNARLDADGKYHVVNICSADNLGTHDFFDLGSAAVEGAEYRVSFNTTKNRSGEVTTFGETMTGTMVNILDDGTTLFIVTIGK